MDIWIHQNEYTCQEKNERALKDPCFVTLKLALKQVMSSCPELDSGYLRIMVLCFRVSSLEILKQYLNMISTGFGMTLLGLIMISLIMAYFIPVLIGIYPGYRSTSNWKRGLTLIPRMSVAETTILSGFE